VTCSFLLIWLRSLQDEPIGKLNEFLQLSILQRAAFQVKSPLVSMMHSKMLDKAAPSERSTAFRSKKDGVERERCVQIQGLVSLQVELYVYWCSRCEKGAPHAPWPRPIDLNRQDLPMVVSIRLEENKLIGACATFPAVFMFLFN
jgi:hypothetical protein